MQIYELTSIFANKIIKIYHSVKRLPEFQGGKIGKIIHPMKKVFSFDNLQVFRPLSI